MWVGFLYTVVLRVLSGWMVMRVSKKGSEPWLCRFHCELDVWVLVVDMLRKFLAVFCLVDDKGVIYKT